MVSAFTGMLYVFTDEFLSSHLQKIPPYVSLLLYIRYILLHMYT